MKTILLLSVLLTFALAGHSQFDRVQVDEPLNIMDQFVGADYSSLNELFDAFRNSRDIHADQVFSLFHSRFDGSPFLVQEWKPSRVIMNNGEKINYDLLYNVFKNEFWIKKEKEIKLLNVTEDVACIEFDGKIFVREGYTDEKGIKDGLLEILLKGKHPLFRLYTCIFLRKESEPTGYEAKKSDKFQIRQQLYYKDREGDICRLPSKRGDLLKIFGDKAGLVEAYCKKNKLKYKKEADLIKIFRYYNTL